MKWSTLGSRKTEPQQQQQQEEEEEEEEEEEQFLCTVNLF